MLPYERLQACVAAIRQKTDFVPRTALVLGSGLGYMGDIVENAVAVSYQDIPHFKVSTAPGHKGQLVFGTLEGQNVAVMQGRYPLYYERDGLYQGIVKDVLDLVTERTGLAFRLVHASTYQDAVDLVKSGEVDMMGGFLDDGYAADGQQLAITESFASLNEVVFRNKLASSGETVFAQIEGPTAWRLPRSCTTVPTKTASKR